MFITRTTLENGINTVQSHETAQEALDHAEGYVKMIIIAGQDVELTITRPDGCVMSISVKDGKVTY